MSALSECLAWSVTWSGSFSSKPPKNIFADRPPMTVEQCEAANYELMEVYELLADYRLLMLSLIQRGEADENLMNPQIHRIEAKLGESKKEGNNAIQEFHSPPG